MKISNILSRKNIIIIIVIFSLVVLGEIFVLRTSQTQLSTPRIVLITIGNTKIRAEVADTPVKQSQGLSGKKELKDGEGMFFMFQKPDYYTFWMKDMNFPIDIIWIDENYKIVDITHSLATSTYPNTVSPQKPVHYVLEVPAEFSRENSISPEDSVELKNF